MDTTLAFFPGSLGATEIIIIAIFGLLIFGKRLPEVGRSLGKGIVEFKKGLAGVEEEVDRAGGPANEQPRQLGTTPRQQTLKASTPAPTEEETPAETKTHHPA